MPDRNALPPGAQQSQGENVLDALLDGEITGIPDFLRPVADTLKALQAAPSPEELSGEADARVQFRALLNRPATDGGVRKHPVKTPASLFRALMNRFKRGGGPQSGTATMPVSIYLADEVIHEPVEVAVEQWLATANVSIDARDEPVIGSWFQSMWASVKRAATSPVGKEGLLTAAHVADSRIVQAQDAYVTNTLLCNVGPVLQSLQPTKDAVVRAGALLIVKIDWAVQVHQLTAAQQAILDHQPRLAASPSEIIDALMLGQPDKQVIATQQETQSGERGQTSE